MPRSSRCAPSPPAPSTHRLRQLPRLAPALRVGGLVALPAQSVGVGEDAGATALGLALDATPDVYVLLDEDGVVLAANANAWQLCRSPDDPIVGRALSDLLPAATAARVRPALEAATAGRRLSADFPSDGGTRWHVAHASAGPGGILLHLHDVTRRHLEEDGLAFLARAGEMLAPVLDDRRLSRVVGRLTVPYLADWCLLVLDVRDDAPRLRATATDAALRRRLLALARREIAGLEDARVLLAAPVDGVAAMMQRGASGGPLPATLRSVASAVLQVPLVHHRSGVVGMLVLGRTGNRRRFGRIDLQLATALGSRVATVLDKARLYEAEQRAIRLRDDVLAIVAHDVRNPLNSIMLAATALGTPAADDPALQLTVRETIVAAAEQMNRLLEDLLDAGRLDAGWGPRERVSVDLVRLVEDAMQAFRWRAGEQGVRLETVVDAGSDLRVEGDAARLTEALANLLDNAVKFTPDGGIVTITAARLPAGVLLSVADTGPGIAPEALPLLFDRFWQAQASGRASAGLGLFVARRIVEGHGGRLTVQSAAGKGSLFRILLPARPLSRHDAGARAIVRRKRP